MRRVWRVLFTTLSIFFIILGLTACGNGADILTDVTLEDDFSGSRVMEVSISKEAFEEYFDGSFEDIKNLISDTCPKELTYEISESESSLICVFSLEFDSVDTYKKKVENILGEEREISVLKGDTFLSQGISYEENFTSEELLYWFSEALIEENYVSSSNRSEIFESDTTKFIFDSKEYETTKQIYVSEIEFFPFGDIDILSKPYYDGTYDRTVVFHIPESTMGEKGEEVTAFLEEGVPSKATTEWDTDEYGDTRFTIKMSRLSLNELASSMKELFHSQTANVEKLTYSGEVNMFEHGQALTETIDASNFISNDDGSVYVSYYVSDDVDYMVEKVYDDDFTIDVYSDESDDYPNYRRVFDDYISQITLNLETKISYFPTAININTRVKGRDKLERDIEFHYNNGLEDAERLQLEESISKAVDGYGEIENGTEDEDYRLILKQEGTEEEVNIGFQTIFNSPSSSTHYARERKKVAFKINSAFEETMYFDDFFGEDLYDIEINYTAKMTAGEKISESTIASYEDNDEVTIKGNTISIQFSGERVQCSLTASKFNALALLWWLLIIIFILALVLAAYMGFLKLKEDKGSEEKRRDYNFTKRIMKILKKKRCSKCKGYIDDNLKFCTKCGREYIEKEQ